MKNFESLVSERAKKISSFLVMDLLEKAKEMEANGENIIHFEVGEPDFDTPEIIKASAISAINSGHTKYTHSLGMKSLRGKIAEKTGNNYRVDIDPDRVIVTSGSSSALFLILSAMLNIGDEVILTDPGYACYPNFINFLGGIPKFVTLNGEDGFAVTAEKIKQKITAKTKAIFINSPANPTGAIIEGAELEKIAALGPMVISDEIYNGIVYGQRAESILEYESNAIVIDGFSKRYAMTGWRLGYAIVPDEFIRPIQKLQQNFSISVNSFVQSAGCAAIDHGDKFVKKMVEQLGKRRDFILKQLGEIGLAPKVAPQGAFYVMLDMKRFNHDSLALAYDILKEAKVAATPGIDFGKGAEGYLRLSYATSIENIDEGLKRISRYL